MDACDGPDLTLQDWLKLRENEAKFVNALREHIESTQRLKLQVKLLQKRLDEKDQKLKEANETILALRGDVQTLQEQSCKSNSLDVQEKATRSRDDLQGHTSPPCTSKTSDPSTSDPSSTTGPESLGNTIKETTPGVLSVGADICRESTTVDFQDEGEDDEDTLNNDGDSDFIPKDDDGKCSDDENIPSPSKKRQQPKRAVADICGESPTVDFQDEGEDDEDTLNNDGDSDFISKDDDSKCSDDENIPSPSKKRQWAKRAMDKKPRHTCGVCQQGFWKLSALKAHQKSHTDRKSSPAVRRSSRKHQSLLEETDAAGKTTERKPYKCTECGKGFLRPSKLAMHHRIHIGEKPYACPLCEKTFIQKCSLVSHMVSHASNKTPVPCQFCQVTFTSSTLLRQHVADHRAEKRNVCSKCGVTFTSVAELREHKVAHAREISYTCPQCNKKFRNIGGLKDHVRTHTGEKPYLCHVCGRSFTCAQHLKTHRRTHTGEKPYGCDECGERFSQGITLRRHQLRHTGEKQHLCSLCGKSFARAEVLKTHQRVHTGEKPFTCTVCGQAFAYIQTLQSHKMRVHANKGARTST